MNNSYETAMTAPETLHFINNARASALIPSINQFNYFVNDAGLRSSLRVGNENDC